MKKQLSFFTLFLVLVFSLILVTACDNDDSSPNNSNNNSKLDARLFGTWVYYQNGETKPSLSWTFNSNGTCVQHIYGSDYNWNWEIESGKIKLFVKYGTPAYYPYKIEENKLYLAVEVNGEETWGLPFTKQTK